MRMRVAETAVENRDGIIKVVLYLSLFFLVCRPLNLHLSRSVAFLDSGLFLVGPNPAETLVFWAS